MVVQIQESYFNNFSVGVVKYGHVLLIHEIPKSVVS